MRACSRNDLSPAYLVMAAAAASLAVVLGMRDGARRDLPAAEADAAWPKARP
jgi:hypothetical protein